MLQLSPRQLLLAIRAAGVRGANVRSASRGWQSRGGRLVAGHDWRGLGCNGCGSGAGDDNGQDEDADCEFHDGNLFLDLDGRSLTPVHSNGRKFSQLSPANSKIYTKYVEHGYYSTLAGRKSFLRNPHSPPLFALLFGHLRVIK